MAQRERKKSKPPAKAAAKPAAKRSLESVRPEASAVAQLEARINALERERDALKAEVEAAHIRIASLDESRRQAANRIEWVIDSLHGLIDKDA